MHYFINTNLFSNYTVSFLYFFLFSPYYNQIFCSFLYVSYYTRTHAHTHTHTHTHTEEKRPAILPDQHKTRGGGGHRSCIISFLFWSNPPTPTHQHIEIHFDKRKGRIIHRTYYNYITEEAHYFVTKSILIMPISFSFFLSFLFYSFKIIQRQTPCDFFLLLLFHFTSYSTILLLPTILLFLSELSHHHHHHHHRHTVLLLFLSLPIK